MDPSAPAAPPPIRTAAVELAAVRARKGTSGKPLLGVGPKGLRHKWLRLDSEGDTIVLTAGKSSLTVRLGVQARDLRLLDAAPASSPPALLAREKAIIVNLEFIKCIITTDHVLILDSGEARLVAFVEELQRRLRGTEMGSTGSGLLSDILAKEGAALLEKAFMQASDHGSDTGSEIGSRQGSPRFASRLTGRLELTDIVEELPFEMRVLEAALDFVTAYMEHLTTDLEAVAHPALDAVISKVTERRLDRLRTIKSRMVRLNTRVETVRELLEKLLDDDDDMRDMNLAAKVRQEERALSGRLPSHTDADSPEPFDKEEEEERDKDQVEQLLETFFMNLDNTWNRLQTLAEYVDDTEDYIRFDIDTKRNTFIEYRLLIIIVTFGVTIATTVSNILGMNLAVNASWKNLYSVFQEVVWLSVGGSAAIIVAILWWARRKKLLLY